MKPWPLYEGLDLGNERITPEDAARQQRTAIEILRRLERQPGVILADEVGMGKTFVAMAVAASVVKATHYRKPVIVMVPRAVADKWPNDWRVFSEVCLGSTNRIRATESPVYSGAEFLKLLDDPAETRNHVIFMTHGALNRSLTDPFITLAVIRQAFLHQREAELVKRKEAFPRWAATLLADQRFTPERVRQLLETPPRSWNSSINRQMSVPDDPVPSGFVEAVARVDLIAVRQILRGLPLRQTASTRGILLAKRRELRTAIGDVWRAAFGATRYSLPLLILDEAHHVKNSHTRLASLFSEDADSDGIEGALTERFDRMLFLTATPFQLGHHELLRVISRFGAVPMTKSERQQFAAAIADLEVALNRSQASAANLESAWSRLSPDSIESLATGWWRHQIDELADEVKAQAAAAQSASRRFAVAQESLSPWIIRHGRRHRRSVLAGKAIIEAATPEAEATTGGLEVSGAEVLPFLLAARTEAMISVLGLRHQTGTRAMFATGLASSYDAYRHRAVDELSDSGGNDPIPDEFRWYRDQISSCLPSGNPHLLDAHPKVAATSERAVQLWASGEKVLIFCHYRATGRALRRAISAAIERWLDSSAAAAGTSLSKLEGAEARWRSDAPAAREVRARVGEIARTAGLESDDTRALQTTTLRFLRSPSFQIRFLDASMEPVDAVSQAFAGEGPTRDELNARLSAFAETVAMMIDHERALLWNDLRRIQTGERRVAANERNRRGSSEATLPTVRLANGDADQATRQRLMRTFNSPFFPEVLIASSVMAEGVDLQLDCRHVIHHDLDWNPSVLEQRTGRVDRVRSKAERTGLPIVVYEPYIGGTQDERLFRVVKDRERWFNIVMGAASPGSLWEFDRVARRVPLPADLIAALTFRLNINASDSDALKRQHPSRTSPRR